MHASCLVSSLLTVVLLVLLVISLYSAWNKPQLSVRKVSQSTQEEVVVSVCFEGKKEEKKKLIYISILRASTNCIIFYYTGENYFRNLINAPPHLTSTSAHTHTHTQRSNHFCLVSGMTSLNSPKCVVCLSTLPWKDTSIPMTHFMWHLYWCSVWCTFLFCWAHSTKLRYSPDSTTTCLYFLPCYR